MPDCVLAFDPRFAEIRRPGDPPWVGWVDSLVVSVHDGFTLIFGFNEDWIGMSIGVPIGRNTFHRIGSSRRFPGGLIRLRILIDEGLAVLFLTMFLFLFTRFDLLANDLDMSLSAFLFTKDLFAVELPSDFAWTVFLFVVTRVSGLNVFTNATLTGVRFVILGLVTTIL